MAAATGMTDLLRLLESDAMAAPVVELLSFARHADGATLDIAIWDDEAEGLHASWRIACSRPLDYRIVPGPPDSLEVHGEHHPAVRQFLDLGYKLFFAGLAEADALSTGEALRRAHIGIAGDAIPFERYVNRGMDIAELLREGSGGLGSGPGFLMDAYASVLQARGASVSRLGTHRAAIDLPKRSGEDRLSLLRIGQSFVVAGDLRAEPKPTAAESNRS